ncbi:MULTISPECIES: dihydrolipoamide acetyltransferase family protein [Okeania]|uniref:Dihydrolipoamide acetyltransferase component of pyruvate dehydrogenase complex n=1 Tax=Okeania hirsuta TaxID=1458930 RepID=A0A3N6PFN0_9CYAN|nr:MULTISPECIES: dihydrolipoamide acetyltransferase family protein [Okeania]NET12189.1 2-oxo acid dehydrogenase subunit E2 [Okeania sp. SIO1H6]NES76304.1 2-oxo acid dehydrogenase subunit E2 [Okeania sp. SIO1H4]NES91705.1 2-oxo acid dehydrogenase subunit E2 [Okeania sp. SIO2B9]NET19749.1 2-oxo acid dehydrogenase subunit E2 [Okeania sp. SIO1H5]NET74572.1 2-oxo acid dehydrogenase subunit E2 [Okeania sp. SIO1F9]
MINEVFMPALSSTMTEGKIVSWQKSTGDWVEKGETVVVVESDKADMDVESFFSGYLANIIVEAGDVAAVGSTIALLAETEAEIETAKQQGGATTKQETAPAASTAATAVATVPSSITTETKENNGRRNGRIIASPRARKLAKKLKVDLSTLKGTGPHGRIVAEDVEMATGSTPTSVAASAKTATPVIPTQPSIPTAPPPPSAPPTPITPGQVVKMNTLQNAVVRNMMVSLSVPTFHVGYTIATDNLDGLYKQIKSKGVTMTAMLAKAIAMTLQQHPLLNAAYVEGGIQYPSGINIAVAVAMPDGGLITPVLQNADKMDIYSLSRTWKGLVEKARAKQLQPDEYSTGTFTLSNLGMFGVNQFDAILPPGQGSILAIGASQPQVVATADGMIGVKRQMQVNITCDHRIIYGADAAAFLQDLAKLIETNPQSLTM